MYEGGIRVISLLRGPDLPSGKVGWSVEVVGDDIVDGPLDPACGA